jgi:phosphoglycerate dehydrogenase-like enzyme
VKIHLVGEAAQQAERLKAMLDGAFDISSLPREAASSPRFDDRIGPDDVVVSLRFTRAGHASPPFALLHVPGAGLDGIDFASLAARTAVCNVFEHEAPIAEYVLWAMLHWEIRPDRMRFMAQTWSDTYRSRSPHGELMGKTVGIFGFGRIGRAIAVRARAFGMRVATLDRSLGGAKELVDLAVPAHDLPKLLHASDYLVLCAPLSAETNGIFGEAELAAMKSSAVLINVSRAELVREADLFAALRDGVIAGACLDVWYAYPTGAEDQVAPSRLPFLDLPNVVGTPHSSAWTTALPERRYRVIAENIRRCRDGLPLLNQVRAAQTTSTGAFS